MVHCSTPGLITVFESKNSSALLLTVLDQPAAIQVETQLPEILEGFLMAADPPNACRKLPKHPAYPEDYDIDPDDLEADYPKINFQGNKNFRGNPTTVRATFPRPWILIADKTECSYQDKVEYAQLAGYSGLIIHNVDSNKTEVIGRNEPNFDLMIPAYFVGEYDGILLRDNYAYQANRESQYIIRIETPSSFYLDIALCFLWTFLILAFMIIIICTMKPAYYMLLEPWCRKRHERRKQAKMLEAMAALPIIEWEVVYREKYENCVICMESYLEKDWVRILRCGHGFHMACIDAWLLKVRRNCPSCKSSLLQSRCWSRFSDSDISEGNYVTDYAHEPRENPHFDCFEPEPVEDSEEFEYVVRDDVLSRRRRNEIWSSSSTLTSHYSTALSTSDDTASPSMISCMAVIHSSGSGRSFPSSTAPTDDQLSE